MTREHVKNTGLEEYYVIKGQKKLRYGYTTGSCAAAASKAAALMLFTGIPIEEVALMTPKGILLHLWLEDVKMEKDQVTCGIRKDGGDDPDATHGIMIYSTVSFHPEEGVHLAGGPGVGRVTKPGLEQKVGDPAINKVPRDMIRKEVEEIIESHCPGQGLSVVISVPEGEKIAQRTFNPRLGIQGGISILGTSGIVVPMSEAALVESIRIEMNILHEAGGNYLLMTPGNYGEAFSKEVEKLDQTFSMKCSNYIYETMEIAQNVGIKGILFVAHIGKFIKVSGGIMNTHSHRGDSRAELLAAQALRAGAPLECLRKLLTSYTTEEGLDILEAYGCLEETMKVTVERIMFYLQHQVATDLELGLILFSSVKGKLGQSGNVETLLSKIQGQKKKT